MNSFKYQDDIGINAACMNHIMVATKVMGKLKKNRRNLLVFDIFFLLRWNISLMSTLMLILLGS